MGNETSRGQKRFPLRRKKSPHGKDEQINGVNTPHPPLGQGSSPSTKSQQSMSLSNLSLNSAPRRSLLAKLKGTSGKKMDGNNLAVNASNIPAGFSNQSNSNLTENNNRRSSGNSGQNAASASNNSADARNGTTNESFVEQVFSSGMRKKVCLDDFTLVQTVGKGSFGRVIQVKKKDTGKIYAMKVLMKEQVIKRKQFEHTMAERRILEDIDHPFIVSLRYAFQTSQKLFMVFDFFNGGELFHYLSKTGRFGEERAKLYSAEIMLGLEHVHSLNIIYRDLKPENLLLDSDGHIRITDFGLSKENVFDDSVKSFCGTPEYLAPEVLRRQKYGKAVDWWSLGTLLYEMIAGLPPFYDKNRERMYKKVLGMELRFPAYMSPEARSVCRGLLQRDPQLRLGYRGAQDIKAHPFYAEYDWQDVYNKKIIPVFIPKTTGIEDTRNVDETFTAIPAAVTPTPADSTLIDKEFTDFTYTAPDSLNNIGSSNNDDNSDFPNTSHVQNAQQQRLQSSNLEHMYSSTNKPNPVPNFAEYTDDNNDNQAANDGTDNDHPVPGVAVINTDSETLSEDVQLSKNMTNMSIHADPVVPLASSTIQ